MIYKTFEDIPLWQEVRKFVVKIYVITEREFGNHFSLSNQLRRAATSILLNIAEGFERKTNKDFARFISISKGSSGECRAILYIASDLRLINKKTFSDLKMDTINISRQLSKFGKYLVASAK